MHATNYQTQEQRNQLVKEYFASQLTRKEFCTQKGISLSSLYRWKAECQDVQTQPLHFLPLIKQRSTNTLEAETQNSSHNVSCGEEIRIEMGNLKFFIYPKNMIPLLKLLLEEVPTLLFNYQDYQVLLACGKTHMRKNINGLCEILQQHFSLDPRDAIIFAFCNREGNRVKLLVWQDNGFCIHSKRCIFRSV